MWKFLRRCLYRLFFRDEERKQTEFIYSLFEDLLGRTPNAVEINYWVKRLRKYSAPTKIYFEIVNCGEFKRWKSLINIDEQKKADFINSLFNDLLGREVDQTGLEFWVGCFKGSSPVDIYFNFINCEDFKTWKNSINIDEQRKTDFINSLFNDLVGREVDETGLEFWVDCFKRSSPVDIYFDFINLEEFKRLHAVKLFVHPGHYYSPIVDPEQITDNAGLIFDQDRELPGIDLREQAQIQYLQRLKKHHGRVPWSENKQPDLRYFRDNPTFSPLDAAILACTIMEHRPKNIIEVGSGYSSAAMLDIIERELPGQTKCCFIEPYPQLLKSLCKPEDFSNLEILPKFVQHVDLSVYDRLESGDILFIDSTHIVKTGSDVVHLVQNVLPRLRPGVLIHFHDIFHPFEYPVEWVIDENRSWNESYYLSAFLTNNRQYEILFFSSFFSQRYPSLLKEALPDCRNNSSASLWICKIGES